MRASNASLRCFDVAPKAVDQQKLTAIELRFRPNNVLPRFHHISVTLPA